MTEPISRPLAIPTPRDVWAPQPANRAERRAAARRARHFEFSASFVCLDDLRDFLEAVRRDSSDDACE